MVWVLVLLNQPGRINFHQPVVSIHCRYPAPGRIPGLVISLVVLVDQPRISSRFCRSIIRCSAALDPGHPWITRTHGTFLGKHPFRGEAGGEHGGGVVKIARL